jgi:hypothetical protein
LIAHKGEQKMSKRKWTMVIIVACLAATAVVIAYAAGKANSTGKALIMDVVQAQRFVLVDKNDKIRAVLGLSHSGGNPMLLMQDKNENLRADLLLMKDGSPALRMWDKAGKGRVMVTLNPDGSPELRMFDKKEKVIWKEP